MKDTGDKARPQCACLNAVLLCGSYGLAGQILTQDGSSYALTWLAASLAALAIWLTAAAVWRRPTLSERTRSIGRVLVALYMLSTAGVYLRGLVALWRQWSLPQTPPLILALLGAALAVYGGRRGIRASLRLCLPVSVTVALFFILDTVLLIPEMAVSRLHLMTAHPELPSFFKLLLLMLLPLPAALLLPQGEPAELRPWFRAGTWLGLGYLAMSAFRAVMLLGPLTVLEPYPLLRSLMLVYMGPALSRMEYWGLMALSAAMLASVMALTAGCLKRLPSLPKELASVAAALAIALLVIF